MNATTDTRSATSTELDGALAILLTTFDPERWASVRGPETARLTALRAVLGYLDSWSTPAHRDGESAAIKAIRKLAERGMVSQG